MKDVFIYPLRNTITFTHEPNLNVCFGQTDGSLEDFLEFIKQDWTDRRLDLTQLPTIELRENFLP